MRPLMLCLAAAVVGCSGAPVGEREEAYSSKCAAGTTVWGVDVSGWQGSINWSAIKSSAKVQFVTMKATEGSGFIDSTFAANWAGARSAGLIRGAYVFIRYKVGTYMLTGAEQVDYLVDTINMNGGLQPGDLPIELDVENTTDNVSTAYKIQVIKDAIARSVQRTGRAPILYTYVSYLDGWGNPDFASAPLWIADYSGASCPRLPSSTWSNWTFWQYSSSGGTNGISGNLDVNYFNGSLTELQAFANGPKQGPDMGQPMDAGAHHPDGATGATDGSGPSPDASSRTDGAAGPIDGGTGGPPPGDPGTAQPGGGCTLVGRAGAIAPAWPLGLLILLVAAIRRRAR